MTAASRAEPWGQAPLAQEAFPPSLPPRCFHLLSQPLLDMGQGQPCPEAQRSHATSYRASTLLSSLVLGLLVVLPWGALVESATMAPWTVLAKSATTTTTAESSTTTVPAACPSGCLCFAPANDAGVQTASCVYGGLTSFPLNLPSSITSLDLQQNKITELGNTSLNGELLFLDLSNNSLSALRAGSLDNLFKVRTLNLSFNAIDVIEERAFGNLAAIDTVNLAFNRLTGLNGSMLFGLQTVRVLNFSGNYIDQIFNHTFLYLYRLEILDLSYNNLQYLPTDAFQGLVSVKSVYLHHNSLLSATGAFNGLQQLSTLDLSYNALHELRNGTFANLLQLNILQLSFNNITEISPTFCGNACSVGTLDLRGNSLEKLVGGVFQNLPTLQVLDLSHMPYLGSISFDALDGAYSLTLLNLSFNPKLSFLHPQLLALLPELTTLDLRSNNLSKLSHVTFHSNPHLTRLFLSHNPWQCGCGLAWVAGKTPGRKKPVVADLGSVTCQLQPNSTAIPVSEASEEMLRCSSLTLINVTDIVYAKIGSQFVLRCDHEEDETSVLTWITPGGLIFHYHPFHPDATSHLVPSEETENLTSAFHKQHSWHSEGVYNTDLYRSPDHVVLQSDGSLYIDFVLRLDAGSYQCILHNSEHNVSATILMLLDYSILFEVQVKSLVVGSACAATFFLLNAVYVSIMWVARKLVNKRRRERINKLLVNLDEYRTTQITRIRTNYSYQLGRIREHYHLQSMRLKDNYNVQMKRVRQGCSNQVDRIRDNYHTRLGNLKDYSSHQIQQIRDATNNQIVRIRDYGSLQMDRLKESYKLQQQHVLKVIEAMNLENCRTIVETECMRTQSMIFDISFPDLDDDNTLSEVSSQNSQNDSVYATALNSDTSSKESLVTVVESQHTCEVMVDNFTTEVLPSDPPEDLNFSVQILPSDTWSYTDCEGETDSTNAGDDVKVDVEETAM